jgi:hypothetical protein
MWYSGARVEVPRLAKEEKMGVNARAKLWYGIVMSKTSLLKLADEILGDEVFRYEDSEDGD